MTQADTSNLKNPVVFASGVKTEKNVFYKMRDKDSEEIFRFINH